jgi:hypothetical protein
VLPSLGRFDPLMGTGAVSFGQWCLLVSGSGLVGELAAKSML